MTNPQTLNTPPLLLLGGYFIFVQNPSIGHLSHTNSTPPVLDGTALQQQFSILGWPTGSSPLHLCTNLHAQHLAHSCTQPSEQGEWGG